MIFMKLTVLGSGTFLSKERNPAGYLLEHGEAKLLFDFGFGNLRRLQRACSPLDVFSLFLSHVHPDHSLGLISLLAYKKHAKIFHVREEKRQFNLYGPMGTKAFYENCKKAFPFIENLSFAVKAEELENSQVKHFGLTVKSKPVRHSTGALAYRVESGGKSIVFSGDTSYCEEIVSIAENADLLVLECSLPNEMPGFDHLTPKDCAVIAKRAKPKKLLLTHFYPMVEETDIKKEVAKEFKGEIILAEDLMELEV